MVVFSRCYIGADHAGWDLKTVVLGYLQEHFLPMTCVDVTSEDGLGKLVSIDYPVVAARVAHEVQKDTVVGGILLCGSGIGMAIAANRFKSVRAVVGYDMKTVALSRQHNNTNVLCLGARFLEASQALALIVEWISTKFSHDARHVRRVLACDQNT